MEILTFPVGIVVGTITVAVSLGDVPRAELRLDGSPVCVVTPQASRCLVELGTAPRVHLLELANGEKPSEKVRRWVNRPGSGEAEVRVRESCPERGERCTITLAAIHPDKLLPNGLRVLLDGEVLAKAPVASVEVPRPKEGRVRVLSVDATFADGRHAGSVRVIGRHGLSDETGASLQAVPVEPLAAEASPETLVPPASLGRVPVRGVEEGGSELVFVVDPASYRHMGALRSELLGQSSGPLFRGSGGLRPVTQGTARVLAQAAEPGAMTFVDPRARERFPRIVPGAHRLGRLERLLLGPGVPLADPPRIADAVAAAGMLAASSQRRRAVVLVLGGGEDGSRFAASDVAAYLAEIMVPLHVWRAAPDGGEAWGAGRRLGSSADLEAALQAANRTLERQRLAWVDGELALGEIASASSDAFRIAGR